MVGIFFSVLFLHICTAVIYWCTLSSPSLLTCPSATVMCPCVLYIYVGPIYWSTIPCASRSTSLATTTCALRGVYCRHPLHAYLCTSTPLTSTLHLSTGVPVRFKEYIVCILFPVLTPHDEAEELTAEELRIGELRSLPLRSCSLTRLRI